MKGRVAAAVIRRCLKDAIHLASTSSDIPSVFEAIDVAEAQEDFAPLAGRLLSIVRTSPVAEIRVQEYRAILAELDTITGE